MGYLERSKLVSAFQRIRREAAGRVCSILILVAPNVDALCALKIVTELLKSDFLSYKVVPVAGYNDIVAANESFIQGRNEIRSVIMIECGATVDLAELLSLSEETMVYLVDSHRPYSLANIFTNSQLLILDDGFIAESMDDLKCAMEASTIDVAGDALCGDEESGSEASDEERSENVEPNREGSDDLCVEPQGKASLASRREYRQYCREKYAQYYRGGTWYGTSVARLAFDIADALSRHSNDFLWCAIMGVTFQQVMELVSSDAYESHVGWLRERCLQLNKATIEDEFGNRDGRIRFEAEFRFMLTRHWSLFNSMLHSRYMATRLAVWRDKGKRLLETFIVKMGIPLAQCKTDFASMEVSLKDSLTNRIQRHAKEFRLDDIIFPSFVRSFGFVIKLSACDAVYALMALIEAPYATMASATVLSSDQMGRGARPQQALPTATTSGASPNGEGNSSEHIWMNNFYCAFDALDYHHIEKLQHGIGLAMRQQQVILHEATTILGHRLLRYGRRFRYVILRHSTDVAWLSSHPLSLTKLALFVSDATSASKRGSSPLVLAAYQSSNDTYLVVGTPPPSSPLRLPSSPSERTTPIDEEEPVDKGRTYASRNHFGLAFRRAAQSIRARVKHDAFESAMIEVKSDDIKAFLHALQKTCSAT